jgi:hypothetical protein
MVRMALLAAVDLLVVAAVLEVAAEGCVRRAFSGAPLIGTSWSLLARGFPG